MDEEYMEDTGESEPVYPEEWGQDDGVGETDETVEGIAGDTDAGEFVGGDPESENDESGDHYATDQIVELLTQLVEQNSSEEATEEAPAEGDSGESVETSEAETPDYSKLLEDILGNQELILQAIDDSTQQQVTEAQIHAEQQILEAQSNMQQIVAGLGIITIAVGFVAGLLIMRLLFGRIMNGGENG